MAALSRAVHRHPYQAILLAAGVGYVLGGGLFTRLTFNALRAGFQMGARPLVQRQLLAAAEATLSSRSPTAPDPWRHQPSHTGKTT